MRALAARAGLALVQARYVNAIGLFGWWLNARILKLEAQSERQIDFFDRWVVPPMAAVERVIRPPVRAIGAGGVGEKVSFDAETRRKCRIAADSFRERLETRRLEDVCRQGCRHGRLRAGSTSRNLLDVLENAGCWRDRGRGGAGMASGCISQTLRSGK